MASGQEWQPMSAGNTLPNMGSDVMHGLLSPTHGRWISASVSADAGHLQGTGSLAGGYQPRIALPTHLAQPCRPDGCGLHGTCGLDGKCICALGYSGDACEKPSFPACAIALGSQPEPAVLPPCASLMQLSPVACECISQCLAAGKEVCGPHSFGCQKPWRERSRRASRGEEDLTTRDGFHAALTCIAFPRTESAHSALPAPSSARLMTYAAYASSGRDAVAPLVPAEVPQFHGKLGPKAKSHAAHAVFVSPSRCPKSCSHRGRCVVNTLRVASEAKCLCIDGSYGLGCESVCNNDCFNDCSGHGVCVHGWCRCNAGWHGVDCSDAVGLRYRRAELHDDANLFGEGPRDAQVHLLPPLLQAHVRRLRDAVYMYELPPSVNREAESWMWRQWGASAGVGCDPVYNRRIYAAQTHFDAHLMHDDYVRTLRPERAKLFYVPVFLNQRVTWGANLRHTMLPALDYIRSRYPFWNASGGRDHVWFIFGERQTCEVPREIAATSIIVGHWGDVDCIDPNKDVVVPTITPIQHDLPRFKERLQPTMRRASAASFERSWPLLFFAGGITSFGASQDNIRPTGNDSVQKQEKWLRRVTQDRCARPDVSCRNIYSMGVRQAVWRQRLWAEPDMRIVSAGVPDYLTAVPKARFCLHTEGNGWGARVVDYMAMECIPLMVNDGMVFPYANVLEWDQFSMHLRKRDIPDIPRVLRNVSEDTQQRMHAVLRQYKRGFVWWRPDGLGYEYTLAALGQRVGQLSASRNHP